MNFKFSILFSGFHLLALSFIKYHQVFVICQTVPLTENIQINKICFLSLLWLEWTSGMKYDGSHFINS